MWLTPWPQDYPSAADNALSTCQADPRYYSRLNTGRLRITPISRNGEALRYFDETGALSVRPWSDIISRLLMKIFLPNHERDHGGDRQVRM